MTARAVRLLALLTALGLAVTLLAPSAEARPRRAKSYVSIAISDTSVLVGQPVRIAGRVWPFKKIGNRRVKLQVQVGGGWRQVAARYASRQGRYSFAAPTSRAGGFHYRVVTQGNKRARYDASKVVALVVSLHPSTIAASYPGGSAKRGTTKVVTGRVAPVGPGRTVYLQRAVPGTWQTLASATTTTTGAYRLGLPTGVLGRWALRVVVVPTTTYAAAEDRKEKPYEVTPDWKAEGRASDHRFLRSPTPRWNPCAVIRYRVNAAKARPGALKDVQQALHRVSVATGLRFEYAGTTSIVPMFKRQDFGDAHLVVAWSNPKRSTWMRTHPKALAVGGTSLSYSSGFVDGAGRTVVMPIQGKVVVNTETQEQMKAGAGSGPTRVSVLMHEIGHVLGLDHATARTQIMYPTITGGDDWWGNGDIAGLRRLGGDQGCLYRAGSQPGARVAAPVLVDGRPHA